MGSIDDSNLNSKSTNRFKILLQSSLRELTKSKRKSSKYFVIVEEDGGEIKNHYLAYYKNKKSFTKNPLKSLYKINLNDCICVYNHDVSRNKAKNLSKQKSIVHHYHHHHVHHHHHHHHQPKKKTSKQQQQQQVLKQPLKYYYTLFIYTIDDYLFISFDKNEKIRSQWYNLLIRLCKDLHQPLKIYEIGLKVKHVDSAQLNAVNPVVRELIKKPRKGYLNSRLCFNDDCSDFIYLFMRNDSSNCASYYEKMSSNDVDEDSNLIKFPITHIKRIGHDKSNRFFIELGKRSLYGQLIFIFKCLNYDLACYLHRKTFQFIDKYKDTQQLPPQQQHNLMRSSRSSDNVVSSCAASTAYTRFNSFSSFLNQSSAKITTLPVEENHNKSTGGNTIKRYCTLFSRNSSKLKTHVSDVFKRLSLSKLTTSSSTEKLSTSKNSDQNSTISSVNLDVTKDDDEEERHSSNKDDRFQSRSNTDGCIILKTLQKSPLGTSFGFLDTKPADEATRFRDRISTLDSIRLESGYESNSLRSSSCGSSNKDNCDIYFEMNYKRKHFNTTAKLNSQSIDFECSSKQAKSKLLDTYSFFQYDENDETREEATIRQIDESIDIEPPFKL